MAYRKTQAIVLRRNDWRENDRILSLLSPELGKIDVVSRSCRKPNSPLMSVSELFCVADFELFQGKGHEIISGAMLVEGFYPLRLEYEKLACASFMTKLILDTAQVGEAAAGIYILLLRSLKRICYGDLPYDQVLCSFMLHFASLSGYKPRLRHCVRCGRKRGEETAFFSPIEGGLVCRDCALKEDEKNDLSAQTLDWLCEILYLGIDKTKIAPSKVPLNLIGRYLETALDLALPKIPV